MRLCFSRSPVLDNIVEPVIKTIRHLPATESKEHTIEFMSRLNGDIVANILPIDPVLPVIEPLVESLTDTVLIVSGQKMLKLLDSPLFAVPVCLLMMKKKRC